MTDKEQSSREKEQKAAPGETSEYYVLKALLEAADNVAGKMEDFNQKYFQETLTAGRAFLEEARSDQRKAFKNLVDEGKDFVSDTKNEGRDAVNRWVDGGRQMLSEAFKAPRETVEGLADDAGKLADEVRKNARETMTDLADKGREIASGVKNDSTTLVEDLVRKGREIISEAPKGDVIEEKVESRIRSFSRRLNLPDKEDIQNLAGALKDLSDKIDAMGAVDEPEEKKK